jgi:hypothetical protein
MAAYKLLLHPQDPDCAPVDPVMLAAALQSIGFIGAPVTAADGEFYPAGAQFLQQLTFLGCSPAIELDPPSDDAALKTACITGSFCHVYLSCTERLQFRADPHTPVPRCPACRQPDADWRTPLAAWQNNPAMIEWTCNSCGFTGRLTELAFRRSAGFARTWIEVRGIYPSEAVPGDALLDHLRTLSGCQWRYIYLRE